jgi:hypothetical protein
MPRLPAGHLPTCPLFGQAELFPPRRRAHVPDLGSPPLEPPRARNSDKPSAHEAAMVAAGHAKEQRLLILRTAIGLGAHGLNASESDVLQGWPAGTSGRRCGEMVRAAVPTLYLVPGLERHTESGCWGQVYQAMQWAGGTCRCPGCDEGRAHVAARDARLERRMRRAGLLPAA